MRRMALVIALVGCGVGCGGAPPPEAAPAPPVTSLHVEGEVAHPAPLDAMSPALRALHGQFEAAIEAEISPPDDRSMRSLQGWMEASLGPFVRAHIERLAQLERDAAALLQPTVSPADRALAAILVGRAFERFVELLAGIPLPDELEGNAEAENAWRRALMGPAVGLAGRASAAYGYCAEHATEETAAWRERCQSRARVLAELAPPEPLPASPSDTTGDDGEAPFGVIGVLRSDDDDGHVGIYARSCETDADCADGARCEALPAREDDAEPTRICVTEETP
ncbi:MAG: hypothetical protein VYE22_37945 [Myxococcota bacterium]|nr:hypothetical protein [Myxococcota bacterium]